MRPETREAMKMLFCAKWNVPQAAKHCNLSVKEMKITFNEYCSLHPITYVKFENVIQLHLNIDDTSTGKD
tara:strand:- start:361 stop:570 length:210 start_codon:yes stop_codon:yes gene_type:complete